MKLSTALMASFLVTTTFISGCQETATLPQIGKATQELPKKLQDKMVAKNMEKYSPILVRVFKEESVVEIWKQTRSGKYDLIASYDICKWSGKLGPKYMEGDRQAPEGFYTIRPSQMNPNSNYYLAFNIGFPNAYDQVNGRTGQHLMVHGACSSSGCYSMSDENIAQIYAFGRDSFKGGQREFQLQAFPFRMTAANMARYHNDPNYKFWTMLKEGYDIFEVTRVPPKVDVCEKRYVFNRDTNGKTLSPAGACPAASNSPSMQTAFASYQKKYDESFSSATEKKMKAPSPTIQGVQEASLVADWSRKRAAGAKVSREPPSLTPASSEKPGAPDITPEKSAVTKASTNSDVAANTAKTKQKTPTGQSLAEEEAQTSGAPVTVENTTPDVKNDKKPFWKVFGD